MPTTRTLKTKGPKSGQITSFPTDLTALNYPAWQSSYGYVIGDKVWDFVSLADSNNRKYYTFWVCAADHTSGSDFATDRLDHPSYWTAATTFKDDGYYKNGFTEPRFINNFNGTITDRALNIMWVSKPTRMITGTNGAVNAFNQTTVAKGAWAPGQSYVKANLVDDGANSCYICLVNHTSAVGGSWATNTSYNVYDTIYDDVAFYYVCEVAHTSIDPNAFAAYQDTTLYYVGDYIQELGSYYKCAIQHTSNGADVATDLTNNPGSWTAITDFLAEDIANHPTYWAHQSATYDLAFEVASGFWQSTVWNTNGSYLDYQVLYDYDDAMNNIEALDYAGYTDWRMPNLKELFSLYDLGSGGGTNYIFDNLDLTNVKKDYADSTLFTKGDYVYDIAGSGYYWLCASTHTSNGADIATDLGNNPDSWLIEDATNNDDPHKADYNTLFRWSGTEFMAWSSDTPMGSANTYFSYKFIVYFASPTAPIIAYDTAAASACVMICRDL